MSRCRGSWRKGYCALIVLPLALLLLLVSLNILGCEGTMSCLNQVKYMVKAAQDEGIPASADLAPLHGGMLFWWSDEALGHPCSDWGNLNNSKLASWRERPYVLLYQASQDIYLRGCEVLEKPASLDVSFRIVSPPLDQIRKLPELSNKRGYVAEIVTMLGLLAKEKLPTDLEYDDLYKLRLGFHFVTADGRPFSADSTVTFMITQNPPNVRKERK